MRVPDLGVKGVCLAPVLAVFILATIELRAKLMGPLVWLSWMLGRMDFSMESLMMVVDLCLSEKNMAFEIGFELRAVCGIVILWLCFGTDLARRVYP